MDIIFWNSMLINHIRVYGEQGMYASHPANHGAWQWGEELLVGFLLGKHGNGEYHPIEQPYKKMLARSMDGGITWNVFYPSVDFSASQIGSDCPLGSIENAIIRVCGVYDTGGEDCNQEGGFYVSMDKGLSWGGPYVFTGERSLFQGKFECSSRTCVISNRNLVFLTNRLKGQFGTDKVLVCKFNDGEFSLLSIVGNDGPRTVMPSVTEIFGRLVMVVRRPTHIDSYVSDDGGYEWIGPEKVGSTGANNGNPASLAIRNGIVYCAYGDRDNKSIEISASKDGASWELFSIIRQGESDDIGYPRLFSVQDGLACVYYWTEYQGAAATIECTRLLC